MQLCITNDACQLQMDPQNCHRYFEYLITVFTLTDIPYNGDSHKILEMVFVRYVLFKDELILRTAAISVHEACVIWQQGGFSLIKINYSIQYTNVIVDLKSFTTLAPPLSPLKPAVSICP